MPLDKDRNILKIPKGTKAHRWRNIAIFGGIAYTIIGFAIAYKHYDKDHPYKLASDRYEERQAERMERLERVMEKRRQQHALKNEPYEDVGTVMGGGRGLGGRGK